jgi:hypothetical protein
MSHLAIGRQRRRNLRSRISPQRLACITSVVGLIAPSWDATQQMIATASQLPLGRWLLAPVLLAAYIFTALPPVFYFALYRDEGSSHVPERLRLLARMAAFISGILLVFQLEPWIKSPSGSVPTLLGVLAIIGNVLLLAALARDPALALYVFSTSGLRAQHRT